MRSLGRKHWAALRESAGDVAARPNFVPWVVVHRWSRGGVGLGWGVGTVEMGCGEVGYGGLGWC